MSNAEYLELLEEMQNPNPDNQSSSFARPKIEWVNLVSNRRFIRSPDNYQVDPIKQMSRDEQVIASIFFACSVLTRYAKNRKVYVPDFDESLKDLARYVVPFSKNGGLPESGWSKGYDFLPAPPGSYLKVFQSSHFVARELLARVASNIQKGLPVPREALYIAASVLREDLEIPAPNPFKPTEMHRDTLLVLLAKRIHALTGIRPSANHHRSLRSEPSYCGSILVAASMHAFCIEMTPKRALKIYAQTASKVSQEIDLDHVLRPKTYDMISELVAAGTGQLSKTDRVRTAIGYINRP